MSDTRKHRGAHPKDAALFAPDKIDLIRTAVHDLSWLLTHGYAETSSLKIVGDRYALDKRQRNAVRRSSCSNAHLEKCRTSEIHRIETGSILEIDGFNVLTTVEAALANAFIFIGRDGCVRDIASMHGSFRKVEETLPALNRIANVIGELGIEKTKWYFDKPVSNSGRISVLVKEIAGKMNFQWETELVFDPDKVLKASTNPIATSDAIILDECKQHFNLTARVVDSITCERTIDFSDIKIKTENA